FGIARLRTDTPKLHNVMVAVGDVDTALSAASLRVGEAHWTRPTFSSPGSPMAVAEAFHPLVENAVPNSVELLAGTGLLVTGSNMSGKSTLLPTLGGTAV